MAGSTNHRRQLSLKWLLVAVLFCGIGFMVYREFIYEPDWFKNASYEKATAFYGRTAQVGPNEIRIKSIVRNDRDGKLFFSDPLRTPTPSHAALASSGPWLDAVQIQLTPDDDLVEIVETRVFDHASGALLRNISSAFGHQITKSNTRSNLIQIYGINKRLPPTLDLWFRVRSHKDNQIAILPVTVGATTRIENSTVELRDYQSGFAGWSSKDGILPVEGKFHGESVFELFRTGDSSNTPYQVVAVYGRHKKFFRAGRIIAGLDSIIVRVPLDQVHHFELRPDPGPEIFFFRRLRLPTVPTPSDKFAAPPTAIVSIEGVPQDSQIPEFYPIDVRVKVLDGDVYNGSFTSTLYAGLNPKKNGPSDLGTATTVVIQPTRNIKLRCAIDIRSIGSGQWKGRMALRSRSSYIADGLEAHTYRRPIEDLKAVKIKLLPPH